MVKNKKKNNKANKAKTETKKEDFVVKEEIQTKKLTADEKILGVEAETKVVTKVDYRNRNRKYSLYIASNKRTIKINGLEVGAFIGLRAEAKKQLEEGAKKVEVKDKDGNLEYKIEVL